MMTLKLMKDNGFRTRILEAESFTVLKSNSGGTNCPTNEWAEITGHTANGDFRYDVGKSPHSEPDRIFDRAYIENSQGKTVEVISFNHPSLKAA